MISFLRHNAIALLALVIALGGTSYAAVQIAPGSITAKKLAGKSVSTGKLRDGAVTNRKLAKDAVTADKVRNRSIGKRDLAAGVLPADEYFFQLGFWADEPAAAPQTVLLERIVRVPRTGVAHLRLFSASLGMSCTAGEAQAGIYVDGVPVPNSARPVPAEAQRGVVELLGSLPVTPGKHTVRLGLSCLGGAVADSVSSGSSLTVVVAAE